MKDKVRGRGSNNRGRVEIFEYLSEIGGIEAEKRRFDFEFQACDRVPENRYPEPSTTVMLF